MRDRLGADRLARELEGVGGAPGRPGVVHVVAAPADEPARLTTRGAVLLRSADLVAGPSDHPAGRLASGAEHLALPVGADAGRRLAERAAGGGVVVRLVDGEATPEGGLAEEIAACETAGVAWEVDPAPDTGPLAAFRERLPLAGRRVLNPRTAEQAPSLSMHIRSLGGTPVEAPVITIRTGDEQGLAGAVRELADGAFAAVGLTSPNGVEALAGALEAAGLDARALAAVDTVACVGPGTAARLAARLATSADVVPDTSTTGQLAEAFPEGEGRVLLPRADIATDVLAEALADRGWTPVEVAAYRTARPAALPDGVPEALARGDIDLVPLASSSTARNLVALTDGRPIAATVVSIGPVTSATCREHGLHPDVEADRHDLDGLVDALCTAASGRPAGG